MCADINGLAGYATWNAWGASQRDLFVLDHTGNVIFHENVGSGIPANLESLVIDLINQISDDDCDSDLMCGEAITCCDGLLYPTTCCSTNCDEPIGECSDECIDGEFDNSNPCNPMECVAGEWIQIVIDCAEQMGVPCNGGVYIPPNEGECCSECVILGDMSGDGILNILDVISVVNVALNNSYDILADMNSDGVVNVLDIVNLVSAILD